MQFERNLTLLRKKKGLSQDELAFAVGVTRQTIYTWEAGLNYPNIIALNKIAEVLEVSTDDLLHGFEVNKLPKSFKEPVVTFISNHKDKVIYKELPNWFVGLKVGNEVNWAIYDLNNNECIKDYSYHVETLGKVMIHEQEGLEVEVKEYDESLSFTRKYNQFVSVSDDGVMWIGEAIYEDGVKKIRTFKDKGFLKDWGYNKEAKPQAIEFDSAKDYLLEINGKKIKVIGLSYFESNKEQYCEVFLNEDFESLLWKRYTCVGKKKKRTNRSIIVEGKEYDLDYYCITSRI